MARRLKDCGFEIAAVYDVRQAVARELAQELGSEAAAKLARVVELCDVIFTVVTDDASMRKVFAGKGDSLLAKAAGKLFINCATISLPVPDSPRISTGASVGAAREIVL